MNRNYWCWQIIRINFIWEIFNLLVRRRSIRRNDAETLRACVFRGEPQILGVERCAGEGEWAGWESEGQKKATAGERSLEFIMFITSNHLVYSQWYINARWGLLQFIVRNILSWDLVLGIGGSKDMGKGC